MSAIQVYTETGELEGVLLHPPGPEVENMTPKNAERALYSDILNLSVARREYNQLECLLQHLTPTFRIMDLLKDILRSSEIREKIVKKACYQEGQPKLIDSLLDLNETQESILTLVFEFCDDEGMLLVDLADLRTTLEYLGNHGKDLGVGFRVKLMAETTQLLF